MKKFVRHILVFTGCLAACMLTVAAWNKLRPLNHEVLQSATIVLGDSHMACAFNPKLFPGTQNISQTAEPLIASFYKLKYLYNHGAQADTVIIGVSYNTFSAYNDLKFQEAPWAQNQLKRLCPIMSLVDFKPYKIDTTVYFREKFKQIFIVPQIGDATYIGEYKRKEYHLDKANLNEKIGDHFFLNSKESYALSEASNMYLDSLIALSQKSDFAIYLVSLPVHEAYHKEVPTKFKLALNRALNKFGQRSITYHEYSFPDSLFADYDHLNHKGAGVFTKSLRKKLRETTPKGN